jgi:N-acyl homoserine lactone hydrolase
MTRRQLLQRSGWGLGALVAGSGLHSLSGRIRTNEIFNDLSTLEAVSPVSVTTASGLRIHGIQTGWIAIKSAHYKMTGIESLRFPAIIADLNWTRPKPMLSWLIEHPEGLIVVDSGERAGARDLTRYLACADAGSQFFITRNFRVQIEPDWELGAQMQRLGLSTRDVRWVVQTHLHFDHANGFAFFPKSQILISRAEYEGHRQMPLGAVSCLYPITFDPRPLDYLERDFGVFPAHFPLTKAEDIAIVPTPGHSYGHQSLVIEDEQRRYLLAGDLTFDERQLRQRELGGIVWDVPKSRESLERARGFVQSTPTVYLPSHDPESLSRLARGQITTL